MCRKVGSGLVLPGQGALSDETSLVVYSAELGCMYIGMRAHALDRKYRRACRARSFTRNAPVAAPSAQIVESATRLGERCKAWCTDADPTHELGPRLHACRQKSGWPGPGSNRRLGGALGRGKKSHPHPRQSKNMQFTSEPFLVCICARKFIAPFLSQSLNPTPTPRGDGLPASGTTLHCRGD